MDCAIRYSSRCLLFVQQNKMETKKNLSCSVYASSSCPKAKSILIGTCSSPSRLRFSIFGCWNVFCENGKREILEWEPQEWILASAEKLNHALTSFKDLDPLVDRALQSLFEKETNIYGEKSVADALTRFSRKHHLDAVILSGDNVYEMLQVEEKRQREWFLETLKKFLRSPKEFPAPGEFYRIEDALRKGFDECFARVRVDRFFVGIGNHDVENCHILNAELSHDERFIFPATYYDIIYDCKDMKVHILMIDTNMYSVKYKEKGGAIKPKYQLHCDQSQYSDFARAQQASWVLERVKAVRADWTILVGHIPLDAKGHKKKSPVVHSELLCKYIFDPLFESKVSVQWYFAADEHDQQFLYNEKRHLAMVVAGSGGAKLDKIFLGKGQEIGAPGVKELYGKSTHGFTILDLTPTSGKISFLSVNSNDPSEESRVEAEFLVSKDGSLLTK